MKAVAAAVGELPQEAIAELEKNGRYTLSLTDGEAVIEAADVEIISEDIPGWLVANEGKLTVALEVTVTEELRREGIARELVNRIQNIRKSSGFEITDKIRIRLSKNQETDDAVNEYNKYIDINSKRAANRQQMMQGISNGIQDYANWKIQLGNMALTSLGLPKGVGRQMNTVMDRLYGINFSIDN